ncbi:MAG: NAD-dependent protein deacylase [Anaerolineales bacterium]|nr:NAD-dependent protein deacylase [Anaerolineales bacterium]
MIHKAASLLRNSKHVVALTGAGISTPSGIPDFRSPGSGLWEQFDPMQVASLSAFRYNPEQFYAWIHPLANLVFNAAPNPAHLALARLEARGFLVGIVTQNIDNLHQRAGSKQVLELHGHLREATCVSCFTVFSTTGMLKAFVESGDVPRCTKCQGILKPKAVLFGEQLPYDVVQSAKELFTNCDLIFVVGSSLEVVPAATLPIPSLNAGSQLIVVNNTPTFLDSRADLVFHDDVALVLPRIADEVIGETR